MELSAVSLADGTTATGLLGKLEQVTTAGDGLLVQGTTAQSGRGVYRIRPGGDGRPAATVAGTNAVTTPTTVLTEQVPATAVFRRAGSTAVLRWTYGRSDVRVSLEVTHTKSGRTWSQGRTLKSTETEAVFDWNGTFFRYGALQQDGRLQRRLHVEDDRRIDERYRRQGRTDRHPPGEQRHRRARLLRQRLPRPALPGRGGQPRLL
ncbi:hypothetical protein ACVW0K_006042 [Streptomyces filamentosus]